MSKKITYNFTSEPEYLREYYKFHNKVSICFPPQHVLIAKCNNQIIGGGHINLPNSPLKRLNTMEDNNFLLRKALPQLHLNRNRYAELSEIVTGDNDKKEEIKENIYRHINLKAKKLGIRYMFMATNHFNAVNYIQSYRSLGFKAGLAAGINFPDTIKNHYTDNTDKLIVFDLKPQTVTGKIRKKLQHVTDANIKEADIYYLLNYFSCVKDKHVRRDILELMKVLSS